MNKRFMFKLLVLGCLTLAAVGCSSNSATGGVPSPTLVESPANQPPTSLPTAAATEAPTQRPAATQVVTPPTASPQPTETSASALPAGDPRTALLQALQRVQHGGPYRTKTTVTDETKGTTLSTTQAEIIPPDRYHIITSLPKSGELIVIGQKAYSKDPTGKWVQAIPQIANAFVQAQQIAQEAQIGDVKLVGPDAVNGVPALVFTFTEKTNLGNQVIASAVKLWVGAANGLPLEQQIESDFGGVKSKTVQFIEYDPSIQINPPIQ